MTKSKPIHPWTPGSVAPFPYKAASYDPANEIYDRPTPIREHAKFHSVRWYRDDCGDDYIPGKYGEVGRQGVGKLSVLIGGHRANNTKSVIPEGSNKYINKIIQRYHWPIRQGGDGEVIFVVPEESFEDALEAIGPYRKPKGGTLPDTPESRERGRRALQEWREKSGK